MHQLRNVVPAVRAKSWKTRGKKLARATVAAVVSLYVLYVVAINTFLSTSLFDRIVNGDPVTLDIHYAKGWSLFPGTIHADHLSIRASDSNVEWLLKLDRVEFDVSFLALTQRRFQVDRARGTGISMRIRQNLSAWPETTEEIADLPPIPGYPAFNVRPTDPHHPELWDDAQYGLITVRLEDIVADDVREVWIDQVRFSGHAKIRGRFYLKPLRAVDIGPTEVEVFSGQINRGHDRAIATDLGGRFDLTADRFDPRDVHDAEALRYFSIHTDLHARSVPLSELPFPLPVYADGTVDVRKVALQIEHGRLAPGTLVEASAPRLFIASDGYMGEGRLDARASVAHEPDGDRLRAETGLATVRVIRSDAKELLHAAHTWARADSGALDLAQPNAFGDLHVGLEVADAVVEDARVANCIVPCSVRVHQGRATMSGRAELWPHEQRAAAVARVAYEAVHASMPTLDVRGSGEIDASFGSAHWDTGEIEGLSLAGVFREAKLTSTTPPLRSAELRSAALGLRVPHLDLDDPLAALDASVTLVPGSDVDLQLALGGKPVRVTGGIGVDGRVTLANHELAGFDAQIEAPDLRARYGELVARARVAGTAASVEGVQSAHIALGNVALGAGRGVTATSASVDLRSAPRSLDVTAHLAGGRVHDGSALASLLPSSVVIASDDGTFAGGARIAVRGDAKKARIALETKRLGVHTPKVSALADASIHVDVEQFDGKTLTLGPSRVVLTNVHGSLGSARRIEVDGAARAFDLEHPDLSTVDAHVALDSVTVPDARVLQALISPRSKLRITSGTLSANGELALAGKDGASGTIAIDAQRAGIALEKSTLEGDLALRAKVTGIDAAESALNLSGSHLALRNIEVKNAAAETRGWSGDLVLDDATLGWAGGDPSFGADILLTADDARPFVGMLLRDNAPKFLAGLVTMPKLALRGRLDADPDEVALTDFYVRGGDVGLRGSYAVRDGKKRGAFIVAKSGLAVGVRIGDDGAHPRFFGLDRWLREEERNVKAKH